MEEEVLLSMEENKKPKQFFKLKKVCWWVTENLNLEDKNSVQNPIIAGSSWTKEGEDNIIDASMYKKIIGNSCISQSRDPILCMLCVY